MENNQNKSNQKNPLVELSAGYEICSAHKLFSDQWSEAKNREIYGKCADLHGHQYRLEITLEGTLPESGMLVNGFEIDRLVSIHILEKIDHKYLNGDVPFFKDHPPTMEWIAVWVHRELKDVIPQGCRIKRIRVYETPNLFVDYSGLSA